MNSSSSDLPVLRCSKHLLGPVAADPEAAPWPDITPIVLRETTTGEEPQQRTWFKTAWNSEELRVLFWIEDTYVWSTMTERDDLLYEEEVVEMFLDPVGDLARYFEIEVNPVNAVLDLTISREGEGYVKDFKWRCDGLQTAVQRAPTGWWAEFSVPFAGIGATPQGSWRANFFRIDRPPGVPRELSAWSPPGRRNFHTPARFGILEFADERGNVF